MLGSEKREAQDKIDLMQDKVNGIQEEARIQQKNFMDVLNDVILSHRVSNQVLRPVRRASSYLSTIVTTTTNVHPREFL